MKGKDKMPESEVQDLEDESTEDESTEDESTEDESTEDVKVPDPGYAAYLAAMATEDKSTDSAPVVTDTISNIIVSAVDILQHTPPVMAPEYLAWVHGLPNHGALPVLPASALKRPAGIKDTNGGWKPATRESVFAFLSQTGSKLPVLPRGVYASKTDDTDGLACCANPTCTHHTEPVGLVRFEQVGGFGNGFVRHDICKECWKIRPDRKNSTVGENKPAPRGKMTDPTVNTLAVFASAHDFAPATTEAIAKLMEADATEHLIAERKATKAAEIAAIVEIASRNTEFANLVASYVKDYEATVS